MRLRIISSAAAALALAALIAGVLTIIADRGRRAHADNASIRGRNCPLTCANVRCPRQDSNLRHTV
jgi:hypothetical protein